MTNISIDNNSVQRKTQLRPLTRAASGALLVASINVAIWCCRTQADELSRLPAAPFAAEAAKAEAAKAGEVQPIASDATQSAATDRNAQAASLPTNSAQTQNDEAIIRLKSDVPPYIDQGVAMVPMRPLLAFLGATAIYRDGSVFINQASPSKRALMLRMDSRNVRLTDDKGQRNLLSPIAVEERLGVVFVPLRFFTALFGASVEQSLEGAGAFVHFDKRAALIDPIAQEGYRGPDATRVTIANRVGKALSLRLTGPQNIAVELGRGQSATRSMRPGVYYYRAASLGMRPTTGVRRLLPGKKATWAWGRR